MKVNKLDKLKSTKERLQSILDNWEDLSQLSDFDITIGLCNNMEYSQCVIIRDLFEEWKHFSGSQTYPVPNPSGDEPSEAYVYVRQNLGENLNMYTGKYGNLRKKLIKFLIKKITKKIDKLEQQ